MNAAEAQLTKVQQYVNSIYESITRMHSVFVQHYFEPLKAMHAIIVERHEKNITTEISESEEIMAIIDHGYELAAIMTDVITTPLFKPVTQENGEAVIEDGVIQLQTDSNGMNLLNKEVLDENWRFLLLSLTHFLLVFNRRAGRICPALLWASTMNTARFDWGEELHQTVVKSLTTSLGWIFSCWRINTAAM